jgi:C_GCAxxG_C_C family probable redox protein
MESRKQIAVEKKHCGLNCAQAVLCAYADIAGIDEETAIRLAAPFGAGMGNMEGTCGAITGAGLVLGLVSKGPATKQMRQIMNKFQERNGATQCKMLKGIGTGKVLRECSDCVADAAEFLEEEIS